MIRSFEVGDAPAGLKVAVRNGQLVGAVYAVRRLVAAHGADLEPATGWIPFFFVHPDHHGRGLGREPYLRSGFSITRRFAVLRWTDLRSAP